MREGGERGERREKRVREGERGRERGEKRKRERRERDGLWFVACKNGEKHSNERNIVGSYSVYYLVFFFLL